MQLEHDLYYYLFAQTSNAIEAIDTMDFGRARRILIQAQQECERRFISRDSSQANIGTNRVGAHI